MSGQQDVVVAGGVEVMSRVPLGAARATGMPYGPKVLARYGDFSFNQGLSAEMIAKKWGFSRTRLDEYSALSHERAAAAQDHGAFTDQIVPVFVDDTAVTADEGVRRGTTVEKLAALKPAFVDDGVIHAGNSSQISDGAAALIVTSRKKAEELGAAVLAEVGTFGTVAGPDNGLHFQPSNAIRKALGKAGLTVSDVDLIEINEAFAAVGIASVRELGVSPDIVNVNGGAIAVGHPLGASGTRIALTLIYELRRRGGGLGAAALCGGGGQGSALLLNV